MKVIRIPIVRRHVKLYPEFIKLYKDGLNDRKISDALIVRDPNTICRWRKIHGLPANITHRPSKVEPHAEKVVRLRQSGMLYREIAAEIDVSTSAIQQYFKKREANV